MARDWTDEEVQTEIANAIAIVREDRFERFARETLGKKDNGQNNNPNNPPPSGGNNADPNTNPTAKKKSIWWGETE